MDVSYPPDNDAGALHRPTDFQATDVIKLGSELICLGETGRRKVADAQRQKKKGGEAENDKETNPEIKQLATH